MYVKVFNIMMTKYYGLGCALLTIATAVATAPTAIAADGLMGECRAAKQSTGLYKERSSSSVLLTSLKMGDKVTIAEAAPKEGMAAVSTPTKGFVQAMNLKMCDGSKPKPNPNPSACRLVTQVKGLAIRKEPMTTAEAVSGVGPNETITLVMPAMSKNTDDGRTWIKISKPAEGWVSEGFTNGSKNVTACP
jgi:hypothetical protein